MPNITMPIIDAKAAYNAALQDQAKSLQASLGEQAKLLTNLQGSAQVSESSFVTTLSRLFNDGIAAQQQAEKAGLQALRGEIEQTELVTAITDAEATLNTIVAVRDRVLSAYQEISRLPI